jgi:lipopolysaccharide export system protein LptC
MSWWLRCRRALDRLTLYLPLLVMALLAMGSWWLVRSMPELWRTPLQKDARKEPDYHLAHFATEAFDAQGRRTRQLSGDEARHYPDNDELHIDRVRLAAVNATGQEVQAQALRGIATGDGERVTLLGQVHVLRPALGTAPRLELHGEHVVALQKQERLWSDQPVQIVRDGDRFSANSMDFDLKSGQYRLNGRVRGELQPRTNR